MNMDENADRLRRLEEELAEVKSRTTVQPGIKGWLVLHAIGTVLGTGLFGLFTLAAIVEGPQLLIMIFGPLFLYFLFFTVSFFQHKKYVPGHMRFLLGLSVILEIAYLATDGYGSNLREDDIFTWARLPFPVIWFFYYGVSERVKVTFTK